ncbi:hypothetical protein BKI52_35560 [marine bacterium AO1-C]|nr:hypothetical protein BKI52_35560 [marine bacterium AO1-C]
MSCHRKSERATVANFDKVSPDTIFIFNEQNDTIPILNGTWENTLNMYAHRKELEIQGKLGIYLIKIFQLNGIKKGLVIEGPVLRLYNFIKDKAILTSTDSISNGGNIKIRIVDMNLDGLDDVILSEIQGAYGNAFTYALVFDISSGTIKHNPAFDLPNLVIQRKDSTIRSKWRSSMCGSSRKSLYKVQPDKPQLFKSITVSNICARKQSQLHTLTYVEGILIKDSLTINSRSAWDIFHKTIWESHTSFGNIYNISNLCE